MTSTTKRKKPKIKVQEERYMKALKNMTDRWMPDCNHGFSQRLFCKDLGEFQNAVIAYASEYQATIFAAADYMKQIGG